MRKTILLNDGRNNICKSVNKAIIDSLSDSCDIAFNKFHNRLFHAQQTANPSLTVWSASEYTQEFHDYVVEYNSKVTIILIVDVMISQPELIQFLNSSNVQIILDSQFNMQFKNTIVEYSDLYEDAIFYDMKKDRNDKTLAILSPDNEQNQKLNKLIYPHTSDKVVAVGNPMFDSPVNLGIFNHPDLAAMLNKFSKVLDLSEQYKLESQACNIPYYKIDQNEPEDKIENLSEHTYKNFVESNILPFIRKKL